MAEDPAALKHRIKEVLIEELMLRQSLEEIGDSTLLFSPDGLGLDSVDALQLVVALDKHFQLKTPDAETAKAMLASVDTIAAAIQAKAGDAIK